MKAHHLLIERKLLEDPVFMDFYRFGRSTNRTLLEAELNAKQIDAIFRAVADGAAKGLNTETGEVDPSSNRTMLGKGADAVTAVTNKLESLKNYIGNSGPVQGFNVAFDKIQGDLLNAAGGESSKVSEFLQTYRKFGNSTKGKVFQAFLLTALGAVSAMALGGLGAGAVVAGVRVVDRLLMGDKASTAIYKAAKAGLIGALAGAAINHVVHPEVIPPGPDVNVTDGPADIGNQEFPLTPHGDLTSYTVKPGDTLSQIAAANKVEVGDIIGLNPQLADLQHAAPGQFANPDVLQPGWEIKLPAPTDGANPYAGGWGTQAHTLGQIGQGNMPDSAISHRAVKESKLALAIKEGWVDRDATIKSWYLSESIGDPRGGVMLTPKGLEEVFRRVNEGIWDKVKSGVGAVGKSIAGAAKAGWQSATNKVTYDKLGMEWRKLHPNTMQGSVLGMVADSASVLRFLLNNGVTRSLAEKVFTSMGIPYSLQYGDGAVVEPAQAAGKASAGKASTKPAAATPAATPTATPAAAAAPAAAGTQKVGDANDLIRDLKADQAKAAKGKATAAAPAAPAASAQPSWADPASPDYVGRREAARRQAAAPAATAPAAPNYAQQGGYGKVSYNVPTGVSMPAAPAAAAPRAVPPAKAPTAKPQVGPSATKVAPNVAGLPTAAEREKFDQRIRAAGGMKESRRRVKEAVDVKLAKEFENFVNGL